MMRCRLHRPSVAAPPAALLCVAVLALAALGCAHTETRPLAATPAPPDGWQAYQFGSLQADPDLPLVLLRNPKADRSVTMVVVLDARNGRETWSLGADPVVLAAVFADGRTLTRLYYDRGFAAEGHASGDYAELPHPSREALAEVMNRMIRAQRLVFM